MNRINRTPTNDFCPQTLFLYGTYGENDEADFGLFCWFSYTWDTELGVMACIGGEKLTKERIHRNRLFSANLVTEDLLPLADYFGNMDGHDPKKMMIGAEIEAGRVLHVPVLAKAQVAFELEAVNFFPLDDGEIIQCKIRNVLQDEALVDASVSITDKIAALAPVSTTCRRYFSWDGRDLGAWGEPMKSLGLE